MHREPQDDSVIISIGPEDGDEGSARDDCTPLYVVTPDGLPTIADFVDTRGIRFGDWMVRRRVIDRAGLFDALQLAGRSGCRIGDAMVYLELAKRDRVEQEAQHQRAFNAFLKAPALSCPGADPPQPEAEL